MPILKLVHRLVPLRLSCFPATGYLVFVAALAALAGTAIQTPVLAADKPRAEMRSVELRFVGGEKQVPLAGVEVLVTQGYGDDQKTFGPYKTDEAGSTRVDLPLGFYALHLKSQKEWPYLPVEAAWNKRSRTAPPGLNLSVKKSGVEKWLNGQRRDEGYEPPAEPDAAPRITYTLLPACELVLRAVDAASGKGLPGVKFYTENALAEDWGHSIDGENLGAETSPAGQPEDAMKSATDGDGNFRRLVGANAGYKYGVESAPPGYEEIKPRLEVEIDILYGQLRAEHLFKFRRVR